MSYVPTVTGPLEPGPLVGGVDRAARVRALHPSDVEGRAAGPSAGATHEALAAYAQAAHPQRRPLTRVDQLMSRDVVSVAHDATAPQAWQLLQRHGFAQAPVLDANGSLVGLLLRADLQAPPDADADALQALAALTAQALMVAPVQALLVGTELREAARRLLETGLSGLPVLDEQAALAGMLTRTDLLRAVAGEPPLDLWS